MRKLKAEDLFAALRVVKAVGVKDEVVALASAMKEKTDKKTQEQVGTELILGVLANCGDEAAEMAFYKFLSGPTEVSVPDLRKMDLMEFAELIKELVVETDIEAWKGFFGSLAGVLKKA